MCGKVQESNPQGVSESFLKCTVCGLSSEWLEFCFWRYKYIPCASNSIIAKSFKRDSIHGNVVNASNAKYVENTEMM